MDAARFTNSPSGRLIRIPEGVDAFIPNPLPPDELDLHDLALPLSEAASALGELVGIGRQLSNPYVLIRPLQRREAVSSSSIEGTHTTLSELFLLEAGLEEQVGSPDTKEVLNYVKSLENSLTSLEQIPICSRMIRQVHNDLMQDVSKARGRDVTPGEFKYVQNFIGQSRDIRVARFVPPPPNMTADLIAGLERFINGEGAAGIPPLIMAALVHYQFETIHPFPDGNGRVGRVLIPLTLKSRGALPQPLLYISPFLEEHRETYIEYLFAVSADGNWQRWIEFFLRIITITCTDTINLIRSLKDLHTEYNNRTQQARASALLPKLVEHLFEQPLLTTPMAQAVLGVTYRAAQGNIDKLVEAGILTEIPRAKRPKIYLATGVLDLLHGARSAVSSDAGAPADKTQSGATVDENSGTN